MKTRTFVHLRPVSAIARLAIGTIACVVLLPALASAASTRIEATAAKLEPFRIAQAPDGAFWVGGANHLVVRFAPDGRVLAAQNTREIGVPAYVQALYPSLDGGVTVNESDVRCELTHYDANAVRKWHYRARGEQCGAVESDAAGNTWIYSTRAPLNRYLARIDAAGVLRFDGEPVALPLESTEAFRGSRRGAGLIVAGRRGNAPAIVEVDTDLRARWVWQLAGGGQGVIRDIDIGADGDISAAGEIQRIGEQNQVLVVGLTAAGVQTALYERQATFLVQMLDVRRTPDGASWLLTAEALDTARISRFASSGLPFTDTVSNLRCSSALPCSLAAAPDSTVWAAVGAGPASAPFARLVRADANGLLQTVPTPRYDYFTLAGSLPDARALAVGHTLAAPVEWEMRAFSQADDPAPFGNTRPRVARSLEITGAVFDAAGDAYVSAAQREQDSGVLDRIAPSGERRWRAGEGQGWIDVTTPAVNSDRVCVIALYQGFNERGERLECFDVDDGSYRFSTFLPSSRGWTDLVGVVRPLADGHTLAWYNGQPNEPGLYFVEVDEAGTIVNSGRLNSRLFYGSDFELTADGELRYSVHPGLIRVARDGTVLDTRGSTEVGGYHWALVPDGTLIESGVHSSGQPMVAAVAADGRVLWTRVLDGRGVAWAVTDGAAIWVATVRRTGGAPVEPAFLYRLSLATGNVEWRREDAMPTGSEAQFALDTARGRAILVQGYPGRVRYAEFDLATGALLGERFVGHAGRRADIAAVRIGAEGGARVAFSERDANAFEGAIVADVPAAPATRGATVLDQAGIAGAWYPAYAPGQGLVIDWIAGSRTLFAPWFTYTAPVANTNDPAQQRWYSLQGTVAAFATRAELAIYENSGGNFDAPPATNARRVGTASLELTSCGEATLRYRFDAGTPVSGDGVIALTRLTPRSFACREANGALAAAQAPASAGGFETRHSGAWFAPATSGQGIMLTVAPGSSLFGAWFTYDDAARGDDPSRQSWITLQAGLADATGGRVTAPLYRTAGGSFDAVSMHAPATWQVGEATLTFLACDRARLDYRFDDAEAAAPQRARSGSIALERLGGCAG
jgi:outer membrane protein assembly factor BamB